MKRLMRALLPLRYTVFHPKYWRFVSDYITFRRLMRATHARSPLKWSSRYPMLDDRTSVTSYDPHYTYHPAWAARILAEIKPRRHVDVASALQFSSIISAFMPVDFYDVRPAQIVLDGLESRPANLMQLPFGDRSVESLSCMHVVEHVGLGRYGDTLDPDGDVKAMHELKRVLAPGGSLLFVVPVGKPVIRYNAHRIYDFGQIMHNFEDLQLVQFALVDDAGTFIRDATAGQANAQAYGCGCWWFRK